MLCFLNRLCLRGFLLRRGALAGASCHRHRCGEDHRRDHFIFHNSDYLLCVLPDRYPPDLSFDFMRGSLRDRADLIIYLTGAQNPRKDQDHQPGPAGRGDAGHSMIVILPCGSRYSSGITPPRVSRMYFSTTSLSGVIMFKRTSASLSMSYPFAPLRR